MYRIIGADGKQYGPVSAEQIRQWIGDRRLNAQSSVQAEGHADWKPLSEFLEFAEALAAANAPKPPPPFATTGPALAPVAIADADYELDIIGCISRGWELLKNNFGLLFVGTLIYMAIEAGIAVLGMIPFVGMLFSLGNLFVVGPLVGGLFYLFLRAIRGQPATAGDVFAGFRLCYLQLFLGLLVSGLLAALAIIPGTVFMGLGIAFAAGHNQEPSIALLVVGGFFLLLGMIPMIYLQVCWAFTLPLIIDRRLEFWPAMQMSRKMVMKHWWLVFALTLLIGLLNLGGLLVCCVGALVTTPIGIGALMYAYETIFRPASPPAA